MTATVDSQTYQTAQDLQRHLPSLDCNFDTRQIADGLNIKRWQAQRMAYVMRLTGGISQVGKQGNSLVYRLVDSSRSQANVDQRRKKRKNLANLAA